MKKFTYRIGDTLVVLRHGTTTAKKVASPQEKILQTYHFSREQFTTARNGNAGGIKNFFTPTKSVCFTCPRSIGDGDGSCYTYKFDQFRGFLALIRSIKLEWDEIPQLPESVPDEILRITKDTYIRFGVFGEPSLLPLEWIQSMCSVSRSWTGYTHRWMSLSAGYANYFMASVETEPLRKLATLLGYRCFFASMNKPDKIVHCPTDPRQSRETNCSKCGLCSGNFGKGKKDIFIFSH